MNNSDKLRILSPLLLFVIHVAYLIVWSPDSFFNKWVGGSFTFFIALVLCNIIRARIVAKTDLTDSPDGTSDDHDSQENSSSP